MVSHARFGLVSLVVLAALSSAGAQDVALSRPPVALKHDRAPTKLLEIAEGKRTGRLTGPEWLEQCEALGVQAAADGLVKLEIIGPAGSAPLSDAFVQSFGGEVLRTWQHAVKVRLPLERVREAADALPDGYVLDPMGRAEPSAVAGEGPVVTQSAAYRDAGLDGSGVTVAVIDFSYNSLNLAQTAGDAPLDGDLVKLDATTTPPGLFDVTGGRHGTGCLENIYDHAPGANYRLYKIDPGSLVDLGFVVADCIGAGVDVISHSISWYNRGWHDDTGPCLAANDAALAGILFFTSAGNRARQHWQGSFVDADGDDWHEFSPGDESININLAPGARGTFYLQWNTDVGVPDYDMYLYDSVGNLIDSSTNGGSQFEDIRFSNPLGVSLVQLQIVLSSGPPADFEIFMTNVRAPAVWMEHVVETGSTTSPSNATQPNVISVAAVDQTDFTDPSGISGISMSYSSRGPSNNGMPGPDLAGPTNTQGTAYTTFGGTSCATPNAAGVAAVLLSCASSPDGDDVRQQLLAWAYCLKDWGSSGWDPVYGYGGVVLPELQDCYGTPGTPDACEIVGGLVADENCNGVADSFGCGEFGMFFALAETVQRFSSVTGVAEAIWLPMTISGGSEDPDSSLAYSGFSAAIAGAGNGFFATGAEPGPDLYLLGGGQGPEFFSAILVPDGITLGVVFDFQGNEFLVFDEPRQVALLGFGVSPDLLVDNLAPLEFPLVLVDGIGDPPVTNALVTADGIEILPQLNDGGVQLTPALDFRFVAGFPDVEVGVEYIVPYDPESGTPEVATLTVPITIHQEPHSYIVIPTQGFEMSLLNDANALSAVEVSLGEALAALNGGSGPEVFIVNTSPAGVDVVVAYGNQMELQFPTDPFPVLDVHYDVSPVDPNAGATFLAWSPVPAANGIAVAGELLSVQTTGATILFEAVPAELDFIRGDFNIDGFLGLADAIGILNYLFGNGADPACEKTVDVNDDGALGLVDGVVLLNYLFLGSPQTEPPTFCGADPTPDGLTCAEYPCP